MTLPPDLLPPGGPLATARSLARAEQAASVVLVEGFSDQIALETLARRRGDALTDAGVAVVPIGGAHAVGRFVGRFPHARLAGLCDTRERDVFLRAGIPRDALFTCDADLEDELIRSHGTGAVERVLAANGDLGAFRTFQKQPAWRDRPPDAQLRRFFSSADRRKLRYARLLLEDVDAAQPPLPLIAVLDYALSPGVTTPAS
jgi:hypothetical protein